MTWHLEKIIVALFKLSQREPSPRALAQKDSAEEGGNFLKGSKPVGLTSRLFHKRPHLDLGWQWVYLSWALVLAIIGVSSFFIVLYGLSYGYQTSIEWLFGSATSFFKSVLLSYPKTFSVSAMRAIHPKCCPKCCENITWLSQKNYSKIKLGKEMLNVDEMREKHVRLAQIWDIKQRKPWEAGEIAKMLGRAKMKVRAFVFKQISSATLSF